MTKRTTARRVRTAAFACAADCAAWWRRHPALAKRQACSGTSWMPMVMLCSVFMDAGSEEEDEDSDADSDRPRRPRKRQKAELPPPGREMPQRASRGRRMGALVKVRSVVARKLGRRAVCPSLGLHSLGPCATLRSPHCSLAWCWDVGEQQAHGSFWNSQPRLPPAHPRIAQPKHQSSHPVRPGTLCRTRRRSRRTTSFGTRSSLRRRRRTRCTRPSRSRRTWRTPISATRCARMLARTHACMLHARMCVCTCMGVAGHGLGCILACSELWSPPANHCCAKSQLWLWQSRPRMLHPLLCSAPAACLPACLRLACLAQCERPRLGVVWLRRTMRWRTTRGRRQKRRRARANPSQCTGGGGAVCVGGWAGGFGQLCWGQRGWVRTTGGWRGGASSVLATSTCDLRQAPGLWTA